MEVDLRAVIRYQVPILLNKLVSSPSFITGNERMEQNFYSISLFVDPPPIQLIRVLCRHFGETVHHIYSDTVRLIITMFYMTLIRQILYLVLNKHIC